MFPTIDGILPGLQMLLSQCAKSTTISARVPVVHGNADTVSALSMTIHGHTTFETIKIYFLLLFSLVFYFFQSKIIYRVQRSQG